MRREQLQSDRAEVGGKTRGPLPGEGAGGRPENRGGHGPPYLNEAHLPDVDVQKMYEDFLRSWARFGLSRVCQSCKTLTPAKQCRPSGPSRISTCRNCLESKNKIHLPGLPPIPAALRALKPIEHHLLAMARISQIVLDKLPSGGPSAQWGRMYAVLMQEPCICDVLDGAVLEDDGTVSVQGVDGLTASSARLEHLRRALHELQMQHTLYQHNPAVQRVLDKMDSILQHRSSEAMAQLTAEGKESRETEEGEDELQFTYLVPKDPKVPRADASELRQTRGSAQLADDIDVKFFPQLFPDGTNGWKDSYKSFSQYARKRLLGQDGRFEQSASYIMWLLETQLKKRLSGNVNVRVGSQQKPAGCHGYQDGSRRVYTALRDIPGTQPYIYAKKGIALNMYEQLGQPQFFLTLTCHARQPGILAAVITARLLRLNPDLEPSESLAARSEHGTGPRYSFPVNILYLCLVRYNTAYSSLGRQTEPTHRSRLRRQTAEIFRNYQREDFTWDGLTANQLCNQHPAVVARQFQHQLRQFLRWLAPHVELDSRLDEHVDREDRQVGTEDEDDMSTAAPAADATGRHHNIRKEPPPFHVTEYIVRIEWQKRGYPHAHILLWWQPRRAENAPTAQKPADVSWSDEEACSRFLPQTAEEKSDKYICTKSPDSWNRSTTTHPLERCVNAKLAEMVVHTCNSYCGRYALGACRFGFPHAPEPCARRRDAQELFTSRWKSSLTVRRHDADRMMGQYNTKMLRRWRASMDLQVICELTSASRYILGYAFKSEEDFTATRRMEAVIERLAANAGEDGLKAQEVYAAAHAALQGRTTSTFEACHLLLGFPVVEFSRDSVWIQAGPPETWTLWVPPKEEAAALANPTVYYEKKRELDWTMPAAQRCYQHLQAAFAEQETELPVEGSCHARCRWKEVTFFDFCAGCRFVGKEFPTPRDRPAIVGYRNFSPDLQPEEFYYSKLLLHLRWRTPGDWLQSQDEGRHAAAFQRIASDSATYPDFLQSVCFPELDGTVQAARKMQAVQAAMYMKAKLSPSELRDGWSHSRVDEQNYRDSLEIMAALQRRHGGNIDYLAPETVPTGSASTAFAPVEGGEAAFDLLNDPNPTPHTKQQRLAMEYIVRTVTDNPNTKSGPSSKRLRLLLHGPGGCGKSVVVRAAAHMLRQSGKGVAIAAPTGVAACNINGLTLHQCLFLPVVNRSHGRACDAPLPRGPHLASMQEFWAHISVLMVDEISFISRFMLDRIDQHLRMARNVPDIPFGGIHIVFAGDLYQLPPPGGDPCFCSSLWTSLELCELEGNQRAAEDPEWAALLARVRIGKWTDADIEVLKGLRIRRDGATQIAEGAVHLFATRQAVNEENQRYLDTHLERTGAILHECPAIDTSVKTGSPLKPELAWAEPENTGGLEGLLKIAVGVRVMLRFNIDVQDKLVNGACGIVAHIDAEDTGEVTKIWVKFEGKAGDRWCRDNETEAVGISRRTASFQDQTDNKAERRQFPLVLAKAITIHKSQAATCRQGAHCKLDSTVTQQGQAYVALSRCPTRQHCTLQAFNPNCLKFNVHAAWALTKLKAQQADRTGTELWQQLMKPPGSKTHYMEELARLPHPNLPGLEEQSDRQQPWACPQCGEETANTKSAIAAHKRVCPKRAARPSQAKPRAKSKAKAKAAAKATSTAAGSGTEARAQGTKRGTAEGRPPFRPNKSSRGEGDTARSAEDEFFEKQDAARCGQHALNNVLGFRCCSAEDMQHAAMTFLVENPDLEDDLSMHTTQDGDYSIEILITALRTTAMQRYDRVCWGMRDHRAMSAADLEGCLGAVQNLNGRHWVALRRSGHTFLYLDSLSREAHPRRLSAEEAEATMRAHPTYAVEEL